MKNHKDEVYTMDKNESQRLQAKSREQRFLNILEQDFNFAPKIAQAILDDAYESLIAAAGMPKPHSFLPLTL